MAFCEWQNLIKRGGDNRALFTPELPLTYRRCPFYTQVELFPQRFPLLTLSPLFFGLLSSNGTANKMNGTLDHSDQPDPDAIKMFVGQIPRSWSEKELKELFEPYGAVYQINVLRDRSQNPPQSKGMEILSL